MLFLPLEPLLSSPINPVTSSQTSGSGRLHQAPARPLGSQPLGPGPLRPASPCTPQLIPTFILQDDTRVLQSAGSQLWHRDSALLLLCHTQCLTQSLTRGGHSVKTTTLNKSNKTIIFLLKSALLSWEQMTKTQKYPYTTNGISDALSKFKQTKGTQCTAQINGSNQYFWTLC